MYELDEGRHLLLGPDVAEDHPDKESATRRFEELVGRKAEPEDYKPRRPGQKHDLGALRSERDRQLRKVGIGG